MLGADGVGEQTAKKKPRRSGAFFSKAGKAGGKGQPVLTVQDEQGEAGSNEPPDEAPTDHPEQSEEARPAEEARS